MPRRRERYAAYLTRIEDPRAAPFLACRTEDGAIVGFLEHQRDRPRGLQSAFLGYGGVAGFAGQGYMSEAMQLLLREAFTRARACTGSRPTSSPATGRRSRWPSAAASS